MAPCDGAPSLRQCELCPLGVAMQQAPSLSLTWGNVCLPFLICLGDFKGDKWTHNLLKSLGLQKFQQNC